MTGNASGTPSLIEGGIVVRGTVTAAELPPPPPGAPAEEPPLILPTGEVEDNALRDNQPDISAQHAEGVEFDDNRCRTSEPAGLCGRGH